VKVNEHGLTPKREAFAVALASGRMNQSEAYRAAYNAERMTPAQIAVEASVLAANPKVALRVKGIQDAAADRAGLTVEEIMRETRRLALSNPAGIIGMRNGKPVVLMPHELDAATAAAIASFEIDDLGRIKYKFWDKNASLERGAKLLGMFEKDNAQKVDALATLLGALSGNVVGPAPGAAVYGPRGGDDDDGDDRG